MANDRNAGRKRKLTPLEEANIVVEYNKGEPVFMLVAKYMVSEATIHRIIRRNKDMGELVKCPHCYCISFEKVKGSENQHKCLSCGTVFEV